MTLKYESEILFDLMKRDGDDAPSDVLPYESELIEKYLEQVEGAYPKLQDYRSEWLNYNLLTHIPAEFPFEALSNVTEATVDNVVPYAYRSAILKGCTLVNQSTTTELTFENAWQGKIIEGNALQIGKKYFVSFDLESDNSELTIQARNGNSFAYHINKGFTKGKNVLSFILEQDANGLRFQVGSDFNVKISNIIILEYQEGMENWDIPYFTGIQSVKLPVLTTVGKNLFHGEIERGSYHTSTIDKVNSDNTRCRSSVVPLIPDGFNGNISISDGFQFYLRLFKGSEIVRESGFTRNYSLDNTSNTFSEVTIVIRKVDNTQITDDELTTIKIQIEEGTAVTEYEPYKTNILTVNEDVTLRSNGDICDELNLLTGQLTQRIGEDGVVLSQEVVKTVDLTVTEQDGNTKPVIRPIEGTMHLMTEGESIKPLFSGEIPVEAITQNLASFIKE